MTDLPDASPNLGLPFYLTKQNEFEVQHNEALLILDALVMLSVLDRDLSSPPSEPALGDRYIVASPGEGAFAGKDNRIAQYDIGGWNFYAPQEGWTCYVCDEHALLAWDGEAWESAIGALGGVTELQNLNRLGVGTEADDANPFAAKLNNALWAARTEAEGGDGDLRTKLNKEGADKTLSMLFQTDYEGRAEIGLTGDDDFHFKTSPDGSTWLDAIILDKTTGATKLNSGFFLTGDISPAQIAADQDDYNPAGLSTASVLRLSTDASRNLTGLSGGGEGRVVAIVNAGSNAIVLKDAGTSSSASNRFAIGTDVTLAAKQSAVLWYDATDSRWKMLSGPVAAAGAGGRETLTANRTYYVRTDGSDSNDGLSNSSGGAFLTIQKAVDTVASLDISIYDVTIQVGNGTYTATTVLKTLIGAGTVTILGDSSTPSNVIVSATSSACFTGTGVKGWILDGLKLTTTTSGNGITAFAGSNIKFRNIDFGALGSSGSVHLRAEGGLIEAAGNYSISGGVGYHMSAVWGGTVQVLGRTVTISGTPAFAIFAHATGMGTIRANANTYSGSATGTRYAVERLSIIFTNGGGASYFPGNSAGSTDAATFGVYN